MISVDILEYLKMMAELENNMSRSGMIFVETKGKMIIWKKDYFKYKLNILGLGDMIKEDSIINEAMKQNKVLTKSIPYLIKGIMIRIVVIPISNTEGKSIGTFSMLAQEEAPCLKNTFLNKY